MNIYTQAEYVQFVRKAAEVFGEHGMHNRAELLNDAADAFDTLQKERDALRDALQELHERAKIMLVVCEIESQEQPEDYEAVEKARAALEPKP